MPVILWKIVIVNDWVRRSFFELRNNRGQYQRDNYRVLGLYYRDTNRFEKDEEEINGQQQYLKKSKSDETNMIF